MSGEMVCYLCSKEFIGKYRLYTDNRGNYRVICTNHSQAGEPQKGNGCLRPAIKEQGNGE